MKPISHQEANELLGAIGLHIGSWNHIEPSPDNRSKSERYWTKYLAPENSHELYNFSQHVAGWILGGKWKILQIDNSNVMNVIDLNLIGNFLSNHGIPYNFGESDTFFWEFKNSEEVNQNIDLKMVSLIFLFLLLDGNAQFVSSDPLEDRYLSIQEGCVIFYSNNEDQSADDLVHTFEKNKLAAPDWILKILEDDEEKRECL